MAENMTKITHRQTKAIQALMDNRNVTRAAEVSGIPARTIYRWLGTPLFCAELAKAEQQAIDTAGRNLVRLADGALAVMSNILAAGDLNPVVRLRAAGMVLDNLIRLRELKIENRLAELEAVVYGKYS